MRTNGPKMIQTGIELIVNKVKKRVTRVGVIVNEEKMKQTGV
jgi:hypothetical protein